MLGVLQVEDEYRRAFYLKNNLLMGNLYGEKVVYFSTAVLVFVAMTASSPTPDKTVH